MPSPTEPAGATPAMRQYFDAKRQYRDAIVFFRMGDFYEMFYEDALTAARALELTLTSRSKDSTGGAIPMCGLPFHAADGYIARLVKKGFRVAVCEQIEDPKKAKGLVRREVVRVVSPGTLTDSRYLDAREPAFLMGLVPAQPGPGFGASLLDLSTGEFTATEYLGADAMQALSDELAVLRPREIVVPAGLAGDHRAGRDAAPRRAHHHARRLDVRGGGVAARAARPAAHPQPPGVRARGSRPRPFAPPAPSCSTCATRRRPTSRTSARSASGPAPTVSSSIRRRCGTSRCWRRRRADARDRCCTRSTAR